MRNHTSATAAIGLSALVAWGLTFAFLVSGYQGQVLDQNLMMSIAGRTAHDVPTAGWLGSWQMPILAVLGVLIAIGVLSRRSLRFAAHLILLIVGTVVAAVVLKSALPRTGFGVGNLHNSFPSSTVAAFTAVGIAVCAVLPRRALPITAPVIAAGIAFVGFTVVSLQWHRPSDVLGGVLTAVAIAAGLELVVPMWRYRSAPSRTLPNVPNWPHPHPAARPLLEGPIPQ